MRFLSDKSLEKLRNSAAAPDLSGTRYSLVRFLASGGMGAVYVAEDQTLGRLVALKVLESEGMGTGFAERLLRESRVLAQLEHPGIVPVYDAGTLADGRAFYVMKLVEGARLDQFIAGISSLSERLRLFLRICDAVSFAHTRGVLHRDLKPANVMVGAFGEVLVMDWGLAKFLERDSTQAPVPDASAGWRAREASSLEETGRSNAVTGDGLVVGTPGYMSPEQAGGASASLDARSDIFSLGKLLGFLANNSPQGGALKRPRSLGAISDKASSENSGDRYATVRDLAADVSRFLDGEPVRAYRENLLERSLRFYDRYQAAILLITAYLVMRGLFILFPRH